jgi:predicted GH43/DUF377 family glycosyl hydrolase
MSPGRIHTAELRADDSRVIAHLFLPGEEVSSSHSRAAEIVDRVMAIPTTTIEPIATKLGADFAGRHPDTTALFFANAAAVSSRVASATAVTDAQRIVLGASFTSEFAVEGAGLCNPSAVTHPDQGGLEPGQLRVALAVRSVSERHLSSIGFAEAIIGPGRTWAFVERAKPLSTATVTEGDWARSHFRSLIEHEGIVNELSSAVLRVLPSRFSVSDAEAAISDLPSALTTRPDSHRQLEVLRDLVSSTYRAGFPVATTLSQRVLMPVSSEENHGMEDARFVRFTDSDGSVGYRATYTAYDGRDIAPRLITSPDLREFMIHRLAGGAAHNKGMALFPRLVGGSHLALSRTDGENISLARSRNGVVWTDVGKVHGPEEPWEIIQTGNCGSPIETDEGWVVLIHGVGPMRTYSIGALLLDLDDPTVVRRRTRSPLLTPSDVTREGYVPNVVYSCGGLIHNDVLWIPIGIGDSHIGVYSLTMDELRSSMTDEQHQQPLIATEFVKANEASVSLGG